MNGKVYFTQGYNFLNHLHWILVGKPQPSNHEGLGSPRLPIVEGIGEELREELEDWLEAVDKQYKAILVKHGLTENITFIGGLSEA